MFTAGVWRQKTDPPTPVNVQPTEKNYVSHIILYDVPDQIEFAGEKIRLDEPDLAERFDKEMIVNTHFHSNTIILIKESNRWLPLIASVIRKYGIPDDFKYLPLVEGALSNARSPRGAVGFWQLLPATARELGLTVNREVDERYNPVRSTEAACKYILRAKEKFGTWINAAAAYNIGMRGLARNMQKQKSENYCDLLLNEETSRYIFRIVSLKTIIEDPEKYGFAMPESQLYTFVPLDSVNIEKSIPDLTKFAFSRGINYKILKRYNPWLRTNSLTIRSSRDSYIVAIPQKHADMVETNVEITDSLMVGEDRIEEDDNY